VVVEPPPPLPHRVDVQAEVSGDHGVRGAVVGGQDDAGTDNVTVSGAGSVCPDGQHPVFLGGQDDHKRGER
jgi:hypothetical protein